MAENVGQPRHRLFPVLDIRQRLLLKLQFVREGRRGPCVVASVPDERSVGLIGVDQDQEILDLTGQPALVGVIDALPQVRSPWGAAGRRPKASG